MRAHVVVVFEETGSHLLARFGPDGSEADGDHEFSVTCRQIDFSGEGNVSVLGARVLPFHLKMLRQVLPSVRCSHKTSRHLFPRRGRRHAHIYSSVLGKKRGKALVIANPSSVTVAAVGQMWREQREQAVVGEFSLQRFQSNSLQNNIAVGIAEHLFMNAVASRITCIDELKDRNSGLDGSILEAAIALFF